MFGAIEFVDEIVEGAETALGLLVLLIGREFIHTEIVFFVSAIGVQRTDRRHARQHASALFFGVASLFVVAFAGSRLFEKLVRLIGR